ncbi:MAG: T9SS type A sorting domain-containing protein, partial [Salibacteraceae bacterium]
AYHNLIIYDSTLNIVNRQPVSHKGGLFIKTSDSTFVLYDETWTYQYTMNFDSIPGYVTGIDEYINKPVAELDVKIYPNPTTGQLTVQFPKSKKTMVKLFTISGMEIAQKQVLNTTETSFDLSPFPKGLYLIRVNSEFGSQTVKVLKK